MSSMHQRTCVVHIPTCSLTTGTYFVWVNCSTPLIIYSCVPSQREYTLVLYGADIEIMVGGVSYMYPDVELTWILHTV